MLVDVPTAAGNFRRHISVSQRTPYVAELTTARAHDGSKLACLNCDVELFTAWLNSGTATAVETDASPTTTAAADSVIDGKHPNAPGYKKWKLSKMHASDSATLFAQDAGDVDGAAVAAAESGRGGNTSVQRLESSELEALLPHLQQLWAERRLVIGTRGVNPLQRQMSLNETLVAIAREAPEVVTEGCVGSTSGRLRCGSFFSGMRSVATALEVRGVLEAAFGADFLEQQKFEPLLEGADQRRRVQALLTAMKGTYSFYHQGCLFQANKCTSTANAKSGLLGQISCRSEEDTPADDCVYAELRFCDDTMPCSSSGGAGAPGFFEYSRFHGPLTLFRTGATRSWVMGQCEEFSRAFYALLVSLGYEARYVLDFTDHVWVEVRLASRNSSAGGAERHWVHADPSEGVLDEPLMYERGWGKNLSIIVAFTPWSIEHVTRSYTGNYSATVLRRGISEKMLEKAVREANLQLSSQLPLQSWGHSAPLRSADRNLENVALWSKLSGR
jgi:hypothetical protein